MLFVFYKTRMKKDNKRGVFKKQTNQSKTGIWRFVGITGHEAMERDESVNVQ